MLRILLIGFMFLVFQCSAQNFVKHTFSNYKAQKADDYKSMTTNGAWCWFSDPRAVYHEGTHKRTYAGWIDNFGNVYVGYYDHKTREIKSTIIYKELEIDDHDVPSILFDENGRLLVFFNMHMKGTQPLFLVKSNQPENIGSWGEVKKLFLNDPALKEMGSMSHTYTNPVKLSAENGRIYLFWRGVDGKPSYSFSDDNGETWSTGKIFFMPERIYSFRRPYTKIYSDGISRIHFTVTDGHPLKEEENSIYYFYYENNAFYKADGTIIKDITELPIQPSEADLVYDASKNKVRAWNWDIALTKNGNPIIAYAKFPAETNHIYCYAIWDKGKWNNYELIDAGKWFPETMPGAKETEPYYSGGIDIDHESPNTMYLSVERNSVFEIEKWVTKNKGKSWKIEKITYGSSKNNVRPFAVRGAGKNNPLQVMWMRNSKYVHFAYGETLKNAGGTFEDRFHSAIKMNILNDAPEQQTEE